MNAAITTALLREVNRLANEIRDLPRDLLQDAVREGTQHAPPAGVSEHVQAMHEETNARVRLMLQWSNQANEQLRSADEMRAVRDAITPEMLARMMKGGGL